ncbi:hypothetical protein R1flu_013990 [Riccia fluitans]|uniref:Uncharacterized protein n=1 Tax=Riccia fluitans TaxID=41844 RepID=A0ABD1YIA6_9MARC
MPHRALPGLKLHPGVFQLQPRYRNLRTSVPSFAITISRTDQRFCARYVWERWLITDSFSSVTFASSHSIQKVGDITRVSSRRQRLLSVYLQEEPNLEPVVKHLSVEEALLLNHSSINRENDMERDKLKDLLIRSENGTYTVKQVLYNRRPPVQPLPVTMDRNLRIAAIRKRQREIAWMVTISSVRFEPFVPTFYRLAEEWLAQGEFDPLVMKELPTLVKESLDRHRDKDKVTPGGERSWRTHSKYQSCAVVGNSGILLNSSYGEQIDSHEMVIRLNNAKIHGFEKHVGSKTTLAFVNSNILRQCSRLRGDCFCHPYGTDVPIMLYLCQAPHLMDVALCRSFHRSALLVTDNRLDILSTRIAKWYSLRNFVDTGKTIDDWDKIHGDTYFHYSSGFQAVLVALGVCERVTMFGFGKSPSSKHHYHTQQKEELGLHDYQAEYIFYNDLVHRRSIPFLSEAGISIPPVQIFH